MEISIVTDEISADPETAIELGVDWGVSAFELRGIGSNRVPLLSSFHRRRLQELLQEYGVRIAAISPGLFKCLFPIGERERFPLRTFDEVLFQQWREPRELVRYHLQELLPQSIEFAKEVGAAKIIAFSFERDPAAGSTIPDEVLAAFAQAAKEVAEAGLELLFEVEAGYWLDTGQNTAEVMRTLNHPAAGVNWDPGNAIVAGDVPYPDGYEAVRPYVRHVHFKDVAFDADGTFNYAVVGDIDWSGQIAALVEDGYDGYISVETHMEPKVRSARAMTERLKQLVSTG